MSQDNIRREIQKLLDELDANSVGTGDDDWDEDTQVTADDDDWDEDTQQFVAACDEINQDREFELAAELADVEHYHRLVEGEADLWDSIVMTGLSNGLCYQNAVSCANNVCDARLGRFGRKVN